MKAVILKENACLAYEEVAMPEVYAGTVRIHVAVCGICGSDIPRVFNHAAHNYPLILGHEFSGVVEAIGNGVNGLEIGMHVVVAPLIPCGKCLDCLAGNYALCNHYSFIGSRQQGGMAEYVVVPAQNVIPIPNEILLEQAATIEPATVALHAFRQARFERGKSVAILGCGIIGLYAVQWAKLLGASNVTVIGRGETGLLAAKKLGADLLLSTQHCSEEELLKKVDKNGYEYVIESSGATQTMQLSLKLVARKGTVCLIGTPKQDLVFPISVWEQINRNECWVTGSWMSYSAPFPGEEWRSTISCMEHNQLKIVPGMVGATYPMAEVAKAFDQLYSHRTSGRTLLYNENII